MSAQPVDVSPLAVVEGLREKIRHLEGGPARLTVEPVAGRPVRGYRSRSPKNASTASTATCERCSVTVEWPRPSSSTRMKASPIRDVSVSKRVPTDGSEA